MHNMHLQNIPGKVKHSQEKVCFLRSLFTVVFLQSKGCQTVQDDKNNQTYYRITSVLITSYLSLNTNILYGSNTFLVTIASRKHLFV